jgi:cytochrome b pre-mRNA-processing protein 3
MKDKAMFFNWFAKTWFAKKPFASVLPGLYGAIVAQARQPVFYRDWAVEDSVQGRYEMICLHIFLFIHRLKGEDGQARDLGEALSKYFFSDMDGKLREIGTGDLAVPKRIKTMGEAFYGRIAAYDTALALEDDAFLSDALKRNVYGSADADSSALASYMRRTVTALSAVPLSELLQGHVPFPACETL